MRITPFSLALLYSFSAHAQMIQYHTGTGFFVSRDGYAVTNEHVIHGCKSVTVKGAVQEENVPVVAVGSGHDLALLKTSKTPPGLGKLRSPSLPLNPGDPLLVMGYPEMASMTNKYEIATSRLLASIGPQGEAEYVQFADAARHGNSGGPLLDRSGNVIGVIVGKSTLTQTEPTSGKTISVQNADLAISLNVLEDFLRQNRVNYTTGQSGLWNATSSIEGWSRDAIVNIQCRVN